MEEQPKRWRQQVREHGVGVAAAVALAVMVVLLVVQLLQGAPDSTTLVLVALAVALLFGLLAPSETNLFFQRMTNLKVAGVLEIGLQAAARAEILRPPPSEDENSIQPRDGRDFDGIVDELRDKLQFIHAITHMHDRVPREDLHRRITYVLGADYLLSEEETQFVLDLLSGRELGLDALPKRTREEFLDAAWDFAVRFRFMVWDRYVRSELRKAGWVIAGLPQEKDRRADFLACWEGRWALMTARVGEIRGYPYGFVRRSLEELDDEEVNVTIEGRCIVIPGPALGQRERSATVVSEGSDGNPEGLDSNVKVLKLQGSLLENPERAFEADPGNDDYERRPGSDQA